MRAGATSPVSCTHACRRALSSCVSSGEAAMNDSTSHGQVLRIGDKPIELRLVALNPLMLRITAVPLRAGDSPEPVPSAPEIIVHETGSVIATIRGLAGDRSFEWGGNRV